MQNQKILMVLEPNMKDVIKDIAKTNQVSMSSVCRDLIREALEIYEDKYWNNIASERDKNFNWNKAISHNKIWGKK